MKRYYNRRFPQRQAISIIPVPREGVGATNNRGDRCHAANRLQSPHLQRMDFFTFGVGGKLRIDGDSGFVQGLKVIGELKDKSKSRLESYNKNRTLTMKQQHPLLLSSIFLLMLTIAAVLALGN